MSLWIPRPAEYWPEEPYPGTRPECSWRLVDNLVHRIAPADGGWFDMDTGESVHLNDRVFILAYGSNANPQKLANKKLPKGLDAVVLRAEITDAQAVWSEGRRGCGKGSRVATVVKKRGHVEACPVLAIYPHHQILVDGWEKPAYNRIIFWGRCTLENGAAVTAEVYVGGENRQPLKKDGEYLPLHDFAYDIVNQLVDE